MSCIQLTTGAGERAIRIVKSFYRWGRNSSSRGGGQLVFDDHWSKRSKLNFLWNQKVKIDDIDTMAGRGGRWIYLSGNDGKWQMILKWVSTFFRWWWCGLGQQDRARIRIQSVGINDGATTEWIHTLYYTHTQTRRRRRRKSRVCVSSIRPSFFSGGHTHTQTEKMYNNMLSSHT